MPDSDLTFVYNAFDINYFREYSTINIELYEKSAIKN